MSKHAPGHLQFPETLSTVPNRRSSRSSTSAGNGAKKGIITGKGVLNNRISEHLMTRLHDIGVPTHFVRRLNMREQLIREVEIIPLEVVVRNVAAGSLATRLGIVEGPRILSCGRIISSALTWPLTKSVMGVSTNAGQSAVDLMPCDPSSLFIASVQPTTACLEAE